MKDLDPDPAQRDRISTPATNIFSENSMRFDPEVKRTQDRKNGESYF